MPDIQIPNAEQVKQLTDYLNEQASFHRWQMMNGYADGRANAHKRASLCEGWAMALPMLVKLAEIGKKAVP